MAANDAEASRCINCGTVFGEPSVVFPAPMRRTRPPRPVKPSKIEVFVTCVLNLGFIAWNIAAIRNSLNGASLPFTALLLVVGVIFLFFGLRNLYRIFAAYKRLPTYWEGRE